MQTLMAKLKLIYEKSERLQKLQLFEVVAKKGDKRKDDALLNLIFKKMIAISEKNSNVFNLDLVTKK